MTEVLGEAAPGWPSAILSGPSFAVDVAAGLPTAVTLASADEELARALCAALRAPNLRLYHSTDVRGVEIGGAAKNVLAIACGVAAGLGLGASAGAALIARGFAELRRFGEAFGARPNTLDGPFRARRPRAHLLVGAVAQLRLRPRARSGAQRRRGERRQIGRGRLHRVGADARWRARAASKCRSRRPSRRCSEGTIDAERAVGALLARPPKGEE